METCWGLSIDPRILNLVTNSRWTVRVTTRSLYSYTQRYSHPPVPVRRKMDGPRSRSGWCREKRNPVPLPGINPRFLVSSSWLTRHTDGYCGHRKLLSQLPSVNFVASWILVDFQRQKRFICHCTCFCFNFGVLLFTEYCALFCGMVVVVLCCLLNRGHSCYSFINVWLWDERSWFSSKKRQIFMFATTSRPAQGSM